MRNRLVYDLPTRFFHWLFAGLFLTAFVIAQTVDDDSPIFSYHMLFGILLSFVVILRIIWGFVGTRHARFANFALHPMDLASYFKGILSGEKQLWTGHNPASSWAAVLMIVMALGLGVTGYFMTSGPSKETFEDLHELLANGFIIVVILHVAGIVLHTLRHQDMIGLSMIDGRKANVPSDQAVTSSRPAIGILMMGLVVAFSVHLFKNYDSQTRTLQFLGSTLQLGENENEGGEHHGHESREGHGFGDRDGDDD